VARSRRGGYVRLLGPHADDASVDRLPDRCARDTTWPRVARRLVEEALRAAEALGRLTAKEQPAESAEFIGGVIKALALLPAEEAVRVQPVLEQVVQR
jgi:hypothetical protein